MNFPSKKNINLKPYNTMAIEAMAKEFLPISSTHQLESLFKHHHFMFKEQPLFMLGGGSNILFTQDYKGLVLHNQIKGIEIVKESDEHIWLTVGAGENWHDFVIHCVTHNYGGLENLSLIPGTVGAAPIQNIGAYGVELKDCFHSLKAYELMTGKQHSFTKEECEFAYRNSIFKGLLKDKFLITSVTFKLSKCPTLNFKYGAIENTIHSMHFSKLSIKVISDAVIQIRQKKLPNPEELPNTGSFFKNPFIETHIYEQLNLAYPKMPSFPMDDNTIKIPAAWLIEQCGWKGKTLGNVGVHHKQALVLVNHNHGTAAEILHLAQQIQHSVKEKFNITLEPEVQLV